MGVVYRALDTSLGREVALKVLGSGARAATREQERRLRIEARAAAALAHPAVSVVYEIDEADGATFIAMELVRGRPLASLIAETPLAPARALELAIEVAEGLAEAHARGVVHRDLKPKNVMLTESGHVKIIDFGLAKLVRPRPPFESGSDTPAWGDTDPGRILGTAAYMSPEQVRGRRGRRAQRPVRLRRAALRDALGRAGLPPRDRRRDAARRAQGARAAAAGDGPRRGRPRCCSACSTAAWPRRPTTATPRPPTWSRTCARRAGVSTRAPRLGAAGRARGREAAPPAAERPPGPCAC